MIAIAIVNLNLFEGVKLSGFVGVVGAVGFVGIVRIVKVVGLFVIVIVIEIGFAK